MGNDKTRLRPLNGRIVEPEVERARLDSAVSAFSTVSVRLSGYGDVDSPLPEVFAQTPACCADQPVGAGPMLDKSMVLPLLPSSCGFTSRASHGRPVLFRSLSSPGHRVLELWIG
jgi:hypothetical protein